MNIAINLIRTTEYEPDDLFTRFVYKTLQKAGELQQTTAFYIFTNFNLGQTHWAGWEIVNVDTTEETNTFFSLSIRSSPIDNVVKSKKIDLIITPLETAHLITSVPCTPLILHMQHWYHGILKNDFFLRREIKKLFNEIPLWFTASEYAKRCCLEIWKVPLNKITVLPPGAEPELSQPAEPFISPPFIISIIDDATLPYLPTTLETLNNICKEYPQTIILIGKRHPKEPTFWGETVFRIEHCPDKTLAGLFQHATLFIYPALHDGSALRVIEALRAGCITVTPDIPAIEERCGEIPFYYHHESPASLNAVLHRVLRLSPEERNERIRLGKMRVVEASWEQTAWKLLSTLKRI